jgi:hypothetical protein
MNVSNSILHYTIIKFIIDKGYAPEVDELANLLTTTEDNIVTALQNLADNHGVVLHPNSSRIWVIHPFSLAPTNFLVRCEGREWWGNCAWCSLGVAALLNKDVTITTTLGANGKQVDVHIRDGQVVETDLWIHFPVPMRNAWDNVIYTCSTMLLFDSVEEIEAWCRKHRIAKGDVQPVAKIWEFSKVWYGHHLDPDWQKWTAAEAQGIFKQFGLIDDIWKLPVSDTTF